MISTVRSFDGNIFPIFKDFLVKENVSAEMLGFTIINRSFGIADDFTLKWKPFNFFEQNSFLKTKLWVNQNQTPRWKFANNFMKSPQGHFIVILGQKSPHLTTRRTKERQREREREKVIVAPTPLQIVCGQ